MDELGPDEQVWLDVLRRADEPTADDRARVRASVIATVAGAGATTATAAGIAKSGIVAKAAGSATGVAATWKIGLAVVVIGVAGGGAALVLGRSSATMDVPAIAAMATATATPATSGASPAAIAEAPPGPLASNEPVVATSPVESPVEVAPAVATTNYKAPSRAAAPKASNARGDDVEAELALLAQAQRALERGDADGALAALGRHGREHPNGALAVEREGLRAIASCEARRPDGRALATRFVAQNATSPLVARVRRACLFP